MRKYHCGYWKRDAAGDWQLLAEKRCNNTFFAKLWAYRQLKNDVCVTTRDCYWRDTGRAPFVRIVSEARIQTADGSSSPEYVENISCEVQIVPSVGELGYW